MDCFPFDVVAFDLDGTLLDTHEDLGAAVNHALELSGFESVPVESSKDLIGGGAKTMLQRALDAQGGVEEAEFRRIYKEMLAHYADHCAVHSRPYRHAEATLQELERLGVRLAVVTNKFESFARTILTKLELVDYFDCIVGGDSLGKGDDGRYLSKPLPDPLLHARAQCGGGSMLFVGDSTYDVKAARAANVPVIAAGYGYCDKAPDQLGADGVILSLNGFARVVNDLWPDRPKT